LYLLGPCRALYLPAHYEESGAHMQVPNFTRLPRTGRYGHYVVEFYVLV